VRRQCLPTGFSRIQWPEERLRRGLVPYRGDRPAIGGGVLDGYAGSPLVEQAYVVGVPTKSSIGQGGIAPQCGMTDYADRPGLSFGWRLRQPHARYRTWPDGLHPDQSGATWTGSAGPAPGDPAPPPPPPRQAPPGRTPRNCSPTATPPGPSPVGGSLRARTHIGPTLPGLEPTWTGLPHRPIGWVGLRPGSRARALEHDGLVTSEAHRGFTIGSPNEELVRELYPVIGALEALALRMAQPSPGDLDEMDGLNAMMGSTDMGSDQSHRLHDRWHRILTRAHRNSVLEGQLDRLRRLARLSESERVGDEADRDRCTYAHAEVVDEFRRGNAEFAASRLERHWAEMVAMPTARPRRLRG